MKPVRTLAHAMLASVFVSGAVRNLLHPEHAATLAEPLSQQLGARLERVAPWVPTGPTVLVRANAALQLGGAALLTTGKAPRLAAVALAGSLLPTTLVGHAFWRVDDPRERANQRNHFLKNLGLLGGLVLAAVDTQGRPGIGWRANHAADQATRRVKKLGKRVTHAG